MVELLKVFDENYKYICDETRENVHKKGLWHETFHCWLVDEQMFLFKKEVPLKRIFQACMI